MLVAHTISAGSVLNGNSTFDYLIIGAGTAGALMANRLSADARSRVLLIEAGPRDNYHWIHIPVGYLYCIGNPRTDWMYNTEPDAGLNGRSLRYPRGKIVGGCSSINGMIYMRGQSRDYDHWAELTGDSTWSWANVLPAFKQHEDHYLGNGGDPDFAHYHGAGGEWHVDRQRLRWDILDAFAQAAQQTGIPRIAPISTAATMTASATSRSTRRTAGAGTAQRPFCAIPATAGAISRCGPRPTWHASRWQCSPMAGSAARARRFGTAEKWRAYMPHGK